MNTLIAVPCMDQVPAIFAQSLSMLEKVDACAVSFNIGSLIYTSREQLAKRAIEMGASHVFWLDSDMQFRPDTLVRLHKDLAEGKGDIISGLYFRRVPPYTPVVFDKLEISEEKASWSEPDTVPEDIFEVEGVGFGCVLMPTDIFIDIFYKYGTAFTPLSGFGEDLSFCWRARQLGFKIVCDPSIELGHVGHHIITRDFYNIFRSKKNDT